MIVAAAALAYSLGAHFQYWDAPGMIATQKGVSIGTPRVDEHLILYFPSGDWRTMIVKSGQYYDADKARKFIWTNGAKIGLPYPSNPGHFNRWLSDRGEWHSATPDPGNPSRRLR